jgi:predicted phage tail protein
VRRVAATDVTRQAQEDWIAARVGEQLFWREQVRADGLGKPSLESQQAVPDSAGEDQSLRQKRLRRGAHLMGIGLVVGGISAAGIAAEAWPFVFVATVGAVLIVMGLLTLLVGLATSSSARTAR